MSISLSYLCGVPTQKFEKPLNAILNQICKARNQLDELLKIKGRLNHIETVTDEEFERRLRSNLKSELTASHISMESLKITPKYNKGITHYAYLNKKHGVIFVYAKSYAENRNWLRIGKIEADGEVTLSTLGMGEVRTQTVKMLKKQFDEKEAELTTAVLAISIPQLRDEFAQGIDSLLKGDAA